MAQPTLFSFFKKKQDTSEGAAPAPRQQQQQQPSQQATQKKTEKTQQDPKSRSGSLTESLAVREAKKISENNMQIDQEEDEPLVTSQRGRQRKRISYLESDNDSEDDMPRSPSDPRRPSEPRKRRLVRKIDSDDDEDGEYIPPAKVDEDEEMHVLDAVSEDDMDLGSPQTNRNVPNSPLKMTPLQERFKQFSVQSPPRKPAPSLTLTTRDEQRRERNQKFKEKNEIRYSWLTDIRDENGNRIGTPEYDPRTLYIPKSAWSSFTAFEHQFWTVKSKYWDTVVFFKKGKFYELYEKDADIGHQEFDLKMTDRVNMRMVGVPESTFDYWAAQFIAKGHKVVRVDQMENAIGKSMRERNESTKADKVIRREVTAVYTAGTLVDAGLLTSDMSTYCMSIKEHCPTEASAPQFGICFTDTATSEFNLVYFEDDKNRTKFETLILQIRPRELVVEKGRLSQKSMRILKNCLNDPLWNHMVPDVEYWDHQRTEDEIKINDYFGEDSSNLAAWPEALRASADNKLLMSALGGLISYLRKLKLDKELLSAGNIHFYDPIRNTTSLVLDGQTLANLEIFQNSYNGTGAGTLFELLNHCVTPFGKRLFRQWLCHPLREASEIDMRLDAVENLMENFELHDFLTKELGKVPDLERLISAIHSKRCKVKEFLLTLEGFEKVKSVLDKLREIKDTLRSDLLKMLVDKFPDIEPQLDFFENAFITADVEIDYQKMRTIIPKEGVNEKWDQLNQQIVDAEKGFEKHLAHLKKELKCSRLAYKDLGKEIYQIEVPKEIRVPRDWIQLSTTSKVSRFWDSTVKKMVTEYKELLEHKNAMVKSFTSDVYNDFDKHYKMWLSAVQSVAKIDALMSLAKASASLGEPSCRPQFSNQEASMIKLEELRHPCVVPGVATDFIPNDTHLGGENPSIMVLTGPNMGGKSTLLRQTCISIIMAQLGCYVPARSCTLTPCDRIYTRIGANDNIMAGQSTFMVELQETSKILHEATPRSMVILDELGRGTSTYDGYAIAYAVLHYLATHVGCLAMFSTHYHTLCREFERNPTIRNMHMAYYMDEEEHNVTFLYKLTDGICEKSFGMNVARMAGVPGAVVSKAARVAEQFESEHRIKDTSFNAMEVDRDETKVSPAVASDLAYLLAHAGDGQGDVNAVRRILKGFQYLSTTN